MRIALGVFLLCLPMWAGREFPARAEDAVVPDELIVRLKPGSSAQSLISNYSPAAVLRSFTKLNLYVLHIPGGVPPGLASRLAKDFGVEFVEPNRVRSIRLASPNDPGFNQQWAMQTVKAVQSWQLLPAQYLTAATAGTNRIKVAVLDTGIDCTHPDFRNQGGTSTDSAAGGQINFAASKAPVATKITSPACAWQDDYGHGTHVAGIIAAATNNGVGMSGLAYPVQLVVYKVLDSNGSGDDSTISSAIMSAADAGVQVISMSLGGSGYSQTLQTAIEYAWQRNVVVVCAAGNSGSNALTFPAGASHAVGVAATDPNNVPASFSNYGDFVEIAAPGTSIYSTMTTYAAPLGGSGYGNLSGTSMATPFVAGLSGLLASSTPGTSAAAIIQRIQQTAASSTLNGGWDSRLGYGVIDAYAAISGTARTATMGAIRGQITDSGNLPIAAQVTLDGSTTIVTDATNGLYRFPSVTAGNHTISISATGSLTQNLSVTVAPGADAAFSVSMGVSYAKFTGQVMDSGVPVTGAIVQALSQALIQATTVTDATGTYTLWVPAGTYTLQASTLSRSGTATPATVALLGSTTINLPLSRFGTIYGHVTSGGQPVANVQIAVSGSSFKAGGITDANGAYATIGLVSGTYTLTATGDNIQTTTITGVTVSAETNTLENISVTTLAGGTATFVKADTTTQGNWRTVYGTDGYNIAADASLNPSYVTPVISGQNLYTWATSTTDVRGLQKPSNPNDRIAGVWYSPSTFIIDLNIADTAQHQVALYCLDWDSTTRRQTVDVLDGVTNAVLNTQSLTTSFNGGVYLVWNLSGHVKLRVTLTGGINTVASGLFFGGGLTTQVQTTATFVKVDATTQGNWRSSYGSEGYQVAGDAALKPTYAAPAMTGQNSYTWAPSTSDVRALQKAATPTDRIAGVWYASSSFTIDLNITDTAPHQVALYCLDWDSATRRQTVDVLDGATNAVLNTQSLTTSFNGGVYLVWNVSGHVKLRVTLTGGANAVVSGFFFGGPSATVQPAAAATFLKTDTTTQGNWRTVYGADGYNIAGDASSTPSYVAPSLTGQNLYIWASSTTDVRGLQKPSNPNDRIAGVWYAPSSFTIDLNITDTAQHQVALYCLDWDATTRRQTVDVLDGNNNVLNTQSLTTSFNGGIYLVWNVTGHVKLRVTLTGGANAIVSGLFFR